MLFSRLGLGLPSGLFPSGLATETLYAPFLFLCNDIQLNWHLKSVVIVLLISNAMSMYNYCKHFENLP
jgi:hypothetical protein